MHLTNASVLSKYLFGFAKTTHVYQSEYLELVARVVLGAGGILS